MEMSLLFASTKRSLPLSRVWSLRYGITRNHGRRDSTLGLAAGDTVEAHPIQSILIANRGEIALLVTSITTVESYSNNQ